MASTLNLATNAETTGLSDEAGTKRHISVFDVDDSVAAGWAELIMLIKADSESRL